MTQREIRPLYTRRKLDSRPTNLFPTVNEIIQSDKKLMKQCLNGFVSERDISKLDKLANGTFIRYAVRNDDGTLKFRVGGTIYRKHKSYITLVSTKGAFWHVSKKKMVVFWRRKTRSEIANTKKSEEEDNNEVIEDSDDNISEQKSDESD